MTLDMGSVILEEATPLYVCVDVDCSVVSCLVCKYLCVCSSFTEHQQDLHQQYVHRLCYAEVTIFLLVVVLMQGLSCEAGLLPCSSVSQGCYGCKQHHE